MSDSIHDYVLSKLEATKGHWPAVARDAGVSYRTLKKIARRESRHPRIDSLERIAQHFRRQDERIAS